MNIMPASRYDALRDHASTASSDLDIKASAALARIAHEMRQPLSAAVAAVSVIRQSDDRRRHARACEILEHQWARLSRLVEDLLVMSRIGLDVTTLRKEEVELGRVVSEVVDAVRPLILKKQQRLDITLPPMPCWIHADETRVEQVLSNVLTNSTNYTDPGGRVWTDVAARDGQAVVTIRDTGRGIAPELLPHVFDMFTSGSTSTGGGLGVGLAVARQLVELHDGTIHVSSEGHGRGSMVVVTFPLIRHTRERRPLKKIDARMHRARLRGQPDARDAG